METKFYNSNEVEDGRLHTQHISHVAAAEAKD